MLRLCGKLFIPVALTALIFTAGTALAESEPPAKKAPNNSGQHQPQGHTGTLSTDSTKGSPPSSPQGDTPSDMQAKPKGKDKGETK